jgi:hypothetical protein
MTPLVCPRDRAHGPHDVTARYCSECGTALVPSLLWLIAVELGIVQLVARLDRWLAR